MNITQELKSLERDGKLYPADVVNAARSPSSPLHPYFDWDDSSAAEKYRLDQARALIRSVQTEVRITSGVQFAVPVYVRDPRAQKDVAGYVAVASKPSRDLSVEIARNEIRAAIAMMRRAEKISAALGVAEQFEEAVQHADALMQSLAALETA